MPESFGRYLWVETLTYNPEEGDPIVLHRGECGVAPESAVVVDVATQAQTDDGNQIVDFGGEQAWDRAILNGYVPEDATVTIVGYRAPANVTPAEACTAETQVYEWTSEPLPGGMAESMEIASAKFAPAAMTTDTVLYFVETTRDALGRTVSEGVCGEPSETLYVQGGDGDIAWTGADSTPALWGGGVALLALFGAASVYKIRRRQTV